MNRKFDVIVVGAGASGLVAAISAARKGAKVLILEHMESAGKKILATGNGKCNFTNKKQGIAYYRGKNPAFVLPVMEQFGMPETLKFFEELGIYPKCKRDGCYYPASEQAVSIQQVLLLECRRQNVKINYQTGIRTITKGKDSFLFETKQGTFESQNCIIATGGKAAKKTGSDGSGMPYIVGFGHKMTDIVPALVQLQGKQSFLKEIAGIRAESNLELYIEDQKIAEERGELQLTEFGISGIPAFQISRFAAYGLLEGKQVYVLLNFLPWLSAQEGLKLMVKRFGTWGIGKTAEEALIGLFSRKLANVLLKEAGMEASKAAQKVALWELKRLAELAVHLRVDIIGSKGFDTAQTTAGGVDTSQIDSLSMESQRVSGLYFAGEVLDIDGMCGGYNLQWAWSSGWVAGKHAAEERNQSL